MKQVFTELYQNKLSIQWKAFSHFFRQTIWQMTFSIMDNSDPMVIAVRNKLVESTHNKGTQNG